MNDSVPTREWTPDELALLDRTPLIRVAAQKPDGMLAPAVPVGHVRLGGSEFVRSLNGVRGTWYRRAVESGQGVIDVDGFRPSVLFRRSTERNDEFDRALRARYGDDAGVRQMVRAAARDATLQVLPVRTH